MQQNNPLPLFKAWLLEAMSCGLSEPNAMTLATVDNNGSPSARIVLLRGVDERGFVFYTNFTSRKGQELQQTPRAALCFYWMPLKKQVRIEGRSIQVSDEEADHYFATRPRGSQISAWASKQSSPMANAKDFSHRIDELTKRYEGVEVPRPPFWSGFRIVPERIEFWEEGKFRMHTRHLHTKTDKGWKRELLYP